MLKVANRARRQIDVELAWDLAADYADILYAWKGPSLLITSMRRECGNRQDLTGYYFREARFLQTLRLTVNGQPPWLCEAASVRSDRLTFNYVHPEIKNPGGGGTGQSGDEEVIDNAGIPERSLDILPPTTSRSRRCTSC